MRALLTGASGFIGKNLKKYLECMGIQVFTLSSTLPQSDKNFFLDSIASYDCIVNCLKETEPNYLFHLAGNQINLDQNRSDFLNYQYFKNIINSLIDINMFDLNILAVGSAAEYGLVADNFLPVSEEYIESPISSYGISKLKQTNFAIRKAPLFKNIVVVRPFNIIGYGAPAYLPLGNFLNQLSLAIKNTQKNIKMGGINFFRDYIDVDDLVSIFWELCNNSEAHGKKINVCTSTLLNLEEIIKKISQPYDVNLDIERVNPKYKNFVKKFYGCNKQLLRILPNTNFKKLDDSISDIQASLEDYAYK